MTGSGNCIIGCGYFVCVDLNCYPRCIEIGLSVREFRREHRVYTDFPKQKCDYGSVISEGDYTLVWSLGPVQVRSLLLVNFGLMFY